MEVEEMVVVVVERQRVSSHTHTHTHTQAHELARTHTIMLKLTKKVIH